MFATAFFGVIDIVAQSLTFSNAGHPPPFVVRRGERTVSRLTANDPEPAAGLIENFAFTRHQCPFRTGDTLLGFTDGLFEAADASGQLFGENRLRDLVAANLTLWGAPLLDRLVGEIRTFTGHSNFEDDLCVVAAESPGGAQSILTAVPTRLASGPSPENRS
jgi:sigma-B regulation protein RsbU (phosphoserine phosphatase)